MTGRLGSPLEGNAFMRIAIPMNGNCLDPHFGHCAKFALIDVAPETKTVTSSKEIPAPEHQHGLLPPWLKERGVTLVIAGGMGAHARSLLQDASIDVITGAPAEAPVVLVRRYLNGTLETEERLCDHGCYP
jgi:predicted Fe-Mo cluster-binding NifX family protein